MGGAWGSVGNGGGDTGVKWSVSSCLRRPKRAHGRPRAELSVGHTELQVHVRGQGAGQERASKVGGQRLRRHHVEERSHREVQGRHHVQTSTHHQEEGELHKIQNHN